MGNGGGFTVVELIITVAVISILTSLVVFMPRQFLISTRDQERYDDVTSIARRLEQAYTQQTVGEPGYPSTTELLTDISGQSGSVARLNVNSFRAPNSSSSSVVAATSTSTSTPITGGVTLNQYVYQPIASNNSLCTAAASTCVKFSLYYLKEISNQVVRLKSLMQQ